MRSWLLRLAAVALLVGLPAALRSPLVLACVCGEVPSHVEELQEATAVFVGTLVDVTEHDDDDGVLYLFEFEVIRVWKGAPGSTIVLKDYWSSCSTYVEIGGDNLVYAYADSEEDYLYLGGSCGNTGPLAYKTQDALDELGPSWPPGSGVVVPRVADPPPDPGETGSGMAAESRATDSWTFAPAATAAATAIILGALVIAVRRRARQT